MWPIKENYEEELDAAKVNVSLAFHYLLRGRGLSSPPAVNNGRTQTSRRELVRGSAARVKHS